MSRVIEKVKRTVRALLKLFLLLLLAVIPLTLFLVSTNQGLKIDLFILKKISGNALTIKKAQGTLSKQFSLEKVTYSSPQFDLNIRQVNLSWSLLKSLTLGTKINDLLLDNVILTVKAPPKKNIPFKVSPISLTSLKERRLAFLLALKNAHFTLNNVHINHLTYQSPTNNFTLKSLLINAFADGHKLEIKEGNAFFNHQHLFLKGEIQFDKKFKTNLILKAKGEVDFTAQITGDLKAFHFKSLIRTPFKGSADFDLDEDLSVSANLILNKAYWPLEGTELINIQTFKLDLNGKPNHYQLSSHGSWKIKNTAEQTFNLRAHGTISSLNIDALTLSSSDGQLVMKGSAKFYPQVTWDTDLTLNIMNTENYFKDLPGTVNFHAKNKGHFGKKGLDYQILLTAKGLLLKQSLSGHLNLTQAKGNMNALGAFKSDSNTILTIKALLPDINLASLKTQALQGNISLAIKDLKQLDPFIPSIKNTTGQLMGKISVTHTLGDPHFILDLNLAKGKTTLEKMGVTLEDINLTLKGSPKECLINGALSSNKGFLSVKGKTSYQNSHLLSDITLEGNNVTFINTNEYKINASPTLLFKSDNKTLLLSGDIKITSAEISPSDFSSTIELPEDIVLIDSTIPPEKKWELGYQLNLDLGDKTQMSIEGLKGGLKGNLRLNAPINQAFRATGSLTIVKGTYQAYGQDLKITQGKFIYAGGPINNPGLLVQASRSFNTDTQYSTDFTQGFSEEDNKITVGLIIQGRLKSLKTELFSVPSSRSQSDILSMLLLGKPLSQASDSGSDSALSSSQLLISALSKLKLGGGFSGAQLQEQLKHTFGIDELNLENQSAYDSETDTVTDNTALVIGKSLSSKLSLRYSVGFSQNANILKIKYQFSPRWAIQTESNGNSNGLDLIFNYHK